MSEENPPTLQVFASETVKTVDVPPGTPASHNADEEKVKLAAEIARLQGLYVPPNPAKTRWVTNADVPRILADGKDMVALCKLPRGLAKSAMAIAHNQVTSTDPLRFFVMPNGLVVINPVIISHTKVPVFKDEEGCMSFPDEVSKKMVPRYNIVTVTYQTLGTKPGESQPVLTKPATETLNGQASHIFQHECGHLNGGTVYDEDYASEKSVGLGDGKPVDSSLWDEVPSVIAKEN